MRSFPRSHTTPLWSRPAMAGILAMLFVVAFAASARATTIGHEHFFGTDSFPDVISGQLGPP